MEYDLGTARGRIVIDPKGAVAGVATASAAQASLVQKSAATHAALRTVGLGLTSMGALAIAGFAVAVNAAAKFEKELSEFSAVSEATEAQMDGIREMALRLGRDTSFSAREAAEAMTELSKAGIGVDDILNGAADAAVLLAEAGGIDIPTAANVAASAMNTFKLSAEDLMGVADSFAGTANRTATTVEDLALAMEYTGASASLLGIPLGDVNVALGLLANRGITGSKAGTNLNRMLINLNPSSAKAASAMEELGIITEDGSNKFFDAQGKMKSLAEVSQILQDSTAGLTDQQKLMALETIFGSHALSAATALAEAGADGFEDLAASIGEVSAEEVAKEKLDNLSGAIEILKGSVETFLINAGTPFQDGLQAIVLALAGVFNWLSQLSPEVQKWIGYVVAASGVALLFAGGLVLVVGAFQKLKMAMSVLQLGALLTNPIGIAIVAILALVAGLVLLYKNSEGFRNFVDPILQATANWFRNLWEQVQNLVDVFKSGDDQAQGFAEIMDNIFGNTGGKVEFFRNLYNAIATAFNWIKDVAIPAANDFAASVGGWGNILKVVGAAIVALGAPIIGLIGGLIYLYKTNDTFRNAIQGAWEWIQDNVIPIAQDIGDLVVASFQKMLVIGQDLKDLWDALWPVTRFFLNSLRTEVEKVVQFVIRAWQLLGDNVIDAVTIAFTFVKEFLEGWFQWLHGIIQIVTGLVSGDWSKVWQGMKDVASGLLKQIQAIIHFGLDAIMWIVRTVADLIHLAWFKLWQMVGQAVRAAWSFIVNTVKAYFRALIAFWSNAIERVLGFWRAGWNAIKSILSGAWNAIRSAVSAGVGAVVGFLRALPGRAVSAVSAIVSGMRNKGREAMTSMRTAIASAWSSVSSWLSGIPSRALSAIGNLGRILYNKGRDLIQGLLDGIGSMIGSLRNAVGDALSALNPLESSRAPAGLSQLANTVAPMITPLSLAQPLALGGGSGGSMAASAGNVTHENFQLEVNTNADPDEIMDAYLWMREVQVVR